MSNPTMIDPIPKKFECAKCKDTFWAVTSNSLFEEPSLVTKGNLENLKTMSQCPLCGNMNTVYWYKTKLSS